MKTKDYKIKIMNKFNKEYKEILIQMKKLKIIKKH